MLEEKVPAQRAQHERDMAELNKLLAESKAKYEAQIADLDKLLKAATDETTVTKQMVDFYKNAYEVCVNADKRSFGCWIWKIVSFGTGKCH